MRRSAGHASVPPRKVWIGVRREPLAGEGALLAVRRLGGASQGSWRRRRPLRLVLQTHDVASVWYVQHRDTELGDELPELGYRFAESAGRVPTFDRQIRQRSSGTVVGPHRPTAVRTTQATAG